MSEISLKAYQAELTDLLQQGRTDEVVRHCRHILEKYPKNVEVYRLMARALPSHSTEAAQLYQRVLSVSPDDAEAHEALSLYYQAQRKGNEAIWHLERAYEQNPNQRAIQAALTELYRQYRGMEVTRFQLTARAVALQHLRSGLYPKAIDTLQKALAQTPDRVDLQVLLAQVYWEAGGLIEAAERALAILKTLPDCLIANQILTLLWLSEQRPSDAQRYLSRIEAVDPYLAVTLAQGTPPEDDAFQLTRLDYQQAASRDLMTENPDWLQALGGVDTFADEEEYEETANPAWATEDDQALLDLDLFDDGGDLLDDDSTDEWLTQLDDLSQSTTSKTIPTVNREELFGEDWLASFGEETPSKPSSGTGLTGLLSGSQQPRTPTGLTGMLSRLEAEAEEDPEPPTRPVVYSQRPTPQEDEKPTATLSPEEEDPLAWMKDTGIEILDEVPPSPFELPFDDDDRPIVDPNADNPFAWMQTNNIELIDEPPQFSPAEHEPTAPTVDEAVDPLAWMRQSGIELVSDDAQEEAEMSNNQSWFTEDDDNDADDLEWLSGAQPTASPLDAADEDDPLDWMLEPKTDAQPNESMPDWLSSAAPVIADDEADVPDWLSSVGTPDDQDEIIPEQQAVPSWLTGASPAAASNDLNLEDDDDFEFTYEEEDTPDWLTSASPIAESQPLSFGLDTTGDGEIDSDTLFGNRDQTPDWLKAASPVNAQDDDQDDDFNLFGTDEDEETDELLTFGQTETPDWLKTAAPVNAQNDDLSFLEDDETLTDFTLDFEDDLDAVAQDEESEELDWMLDNSENTPEWMQTINDPTSTPTRPVATEAIAESDEEWLFEEDQAAAQDLPDWLTAAPVAATAATAATAFAWDDVQTSDEQPLEETAPTAANNAPDWLNAMVPGLDISYETESVEPVPTPTVKRDYDWVNQIVEEELRAPVSMPEKDGRKPRFIFSRLPVWMRGGGSTQAQPQTQTVDADQEDDLPPWLSFDDDDEPEAR